MTKGCSKRFKRQMGPLTDLLHQFRWPLWALTHNPFWDSAEDGPHTTPESYYCACYNSYKKESAHYQ